VRLLTERRAFATETVFIITVMDKSTETSCRVKYRTEKDRPRAAELDSLVSRGRWVSEGLGKMGGEDWCPKASEGSGGFGRVALGLLSRAARWIPRPTGL
jgi:hypothetical protein